jgi:hypothetical protein
LHTSSTHLPRPGTIIASSFTSPLDPLYLAGIFQPLFTRAYPSTRLVEHITLFRAILLAFSPPALAPPPGAKLHSLASLAAAHPNKIICVFPESTTTNGRGILPISQCLLDTKPGALVYPVNLRYTPGDITTPVPGGVAAWIWKLLHKPSHQMRVRIAAGITTPTHAQTNGVNARASGYDTNIFDGPGFEDEDREEGVSAEEQKFLERVGEDLARLGRVKRVGLGVKEKVEFVKVWGSRKR